MQLPLTLKTTNAQKRQSCIVKNSSFMDYAHSDGHTPNLSQFYHFFCVVTDIDECTTNKHDCHLYATCSNTGGSFTCSCNQGYSGDGKQCDGMFVILVSRKRKIPCWPGCCGKGRIVWLGGGCQANIKVFLRYFKNDVLQSYLFYLSVTCLHIR